MSQSTKTICCPVPTAIASAVTTLNPCASDVGQIQKMVFWRRGQSISSIASSVDSAYWVTLLATGTDAKAVVTPFLGNVEIPASEPREFGGGNETRWGAPIRKGGSTVTVTGSMYGNDQDVIASLKQMSCEPLDVIFINESNQFVYSDNSTATTVMGFQIAFGSLNFSDKQVGGLDDSDQNKLIFNLKPNWSDTLEISTETTFALDMLNS